VPRAVCRIGIAVAATCSIIAAIIAISRYLLVNIPSLNMDLVCDLQFNELKIWKNAIVTNANVWALMTFCVLKLNIANVPIAMNALT